MTTPPAGVAAEHSHPPYPPDHYDYRHGVGQEGPHRHGHPRGDWHHTHPAGIAGDYDAANKPAATL